jgi:hypothetical protein
MPKLNTKWGRSIVTALVSKKTRAKPKNSSGSKG